MGKHKIICGGQDAGRLAVFDCGDHYTVERTSNGMLFSSVLLVSTSKRSAVRYWRDNKRDPLVGQDNV